MSYNSPFTGNVIQPTDVSYRSFTLTSDVQLEWPINGNATGNYAARIMQVTATTAGLSFDMPPANQASVGQDALIRNVGSNSFTVKDFFGDHTIITIAPGESKYIYITANPDAHGTWGIIAFGAGSSSADAATLAGYGLVALNTTLNQSHPVTTTSNPTTLTSSYRAAALVWTGGAGTFTLDLATTLGNNWFTMVRNSGSGALTIAGQSGNTINGSTNIVLQPADSAMIVSSGTTFYTVGLGKSTLFNFTQLTKTVSSGTYTLTATEASNVVQKYTGTLTGNVTIILPATVQVYYILNATSAGPYTLTFTTGSGGTATVPGSAQSILVCDSVNILNANTYLAGSTGISLSDGTVGSPSLNFATETSTGIYHATSGQMNVAILGVNLASFSATGLSVSGTGTFTGGISGGVF